MERILGILSSLHFSTAEPFLPTKAYAENQDIKMINGEPVPGKAGAYQTCPAASCPATTLQLRKLGPGKGQWAAQGLV